MWELATWWQLYERRELAVKVSCSKHYDAPAYDASEPLLGIKDFLIFVLDSASEDFHL